MYVAALTRLKKMAPRQESFLVGSAGEVAVLDGISDPCGLSADESSIGQAAADQATAAKHIDEEALTTDTPWGLRQPFPTKGVAFSSRCRRKPALPSELVWRVIAHCRPETRKVPATKELGMTPGT